MNSSISSFESDRAKLQLGLLSGLFILILAAIAFIHLNTPLPASKKNGYMLGAIDNQQRLQNSKDGRRRILLVGGSSLGFSVSAEELSAELGERVVNLGVHAGFGYGNIWRMYRAELDPRTDLIVLSPEYGMLLKGDRITKEFCRVVYLSKAPKLLLNNISCLPYIINTNILDIFQPKKISKKNHNNVYYRAAFNKYGDVISHLNLKNAKFDHSSASNFKKLKPRNLGAYINFVKNEIIKAGFQVIVIPPIIPNTSCGKNSDDILMGIYQRLSGLSTIKINPNNIPKPTFCMADNLFFNTAYHLNKTGRKIKTDIFAEYLRLILNKMR